MVEAFHGPLQCQNEPSCSSEIDRLTFQAFAGNIILPIVLTRHSKIVRVTLESSFGQFVYMFPNFVFTYFELLGS